MPDNYQQATEGNAAATAAQAAAIVAAWRAGRVRTPDLPTWLATSIRAGAARAVSLADVALSAQLTRTIERPVPAVGLVLPDQIAAQIERGVQTVINVPDDVELRVRRLATAAPLDVGQQAYQDAMTAQGVEGWIRQTDANPCPLCIELADGKVIGIDKRMIRHPGCSCIAVPVLTGAQPYQRPDEGPDAPAAFVPRTLTTGHGIAGRSYTRVRPGLTITRSVFVPARRAAR